MYCNGYNTLATYKCAYMDDCSMRDSIPKTAVCQSICLIIDRIGFKWLDRSKLLCCGNNRNNSPVGVSILLSLTMAGHHNSGENEVSLKKNRWYFKKDKFLYNKINWTHYRFSLGNVWKTTAGRSRRCKVFIVTF